MQVIEFIIREKLGKSSKQLLNEGLIPAVVYNAKTESTPIQVSEKLVHTLLKTATSTTIIDATVGDKKMKVVLKGVERNPLTDTVRHLSFFQIDESAPMHFTIPFNIIGVSPAVKNNLGILVKALAGLNVRCRLADLIPQIDIDVSELEHPGQSISVSDLKLPEGITLPNDEQAHSAIVTITELQKVEEVKPVTTEETTAEGEASAEQPATEEANEAKE